MRGRALIKYISDGTWFDKGTEAILIDDYSLENPKYTFGLFFGVKDGKPDEEVCQFEEFEIQEE